MRACSLLWAAHHPAGASGAGLSLSKRGGRGCRQPCKAPEAGWGQQQPVARRCVTRAQLGMLAPLAGQVIKGWDLGVAKMKKGEVRAPR